MEEIKQAPHGTFYCNFRVCGVCIGCTRTEYYSNRLTAAREAAFNASTKEAFEDAYKKSLVELSHFHRASRDHDLHAGEGLSTSAEYEANMLMLHPPEVPVDYVFEEQTVGDEDVIVDELLNDQ